MLCIGVMSVMLSSRTDEGGGALIDRLFPVIVREHAVGSGVFVPGSFAASFLLPSLAAMWILNLVSGSYFGPLRSKGAPFFFYILFLILAITDVAADVLIPILALKAPWGFRVAVASVNGLFFGSVVVASVLSRGSEQEW